MIIISWLIKTYETTMIQNRQPLSHSVWYPNTINYWATSEVCVGFVFFIWVLAFYHSWRPRRRAFVGLELWQWTSRRWNRRAALRAWSMAVQEAPSRALMVGPGLMGKWNPKPCDCDRHSIRAEIVRRLGQPVVACWLLQLSELQMCQTSVAFTVITPN